MKSHYADYLLACCSLARTGDTMRGQQRSGWFHQSGEISCHRQILLLFSSVFLFTHLCFIHFLSNFLFHLSGHGFTSCFSASPFLWMSLSGSPVSEPRLQPVLPSCCIFVWILLCLLWKRTALKSIQRNGSGVFFQSKDESGVSVDNSWFGPFSHSNGSIKTQARSCRNDQLLLPAQYWRWSFPLSCFRCPPPAGLNKTACLI